MLTFLKDKTFGPLDANGVQAHRQHLLIEERPLAARPGCDLHLRDLPQSERDTLPLTDSAQVICHYIFFSPYVNRGQLEPKGRQHQRDLFGNIVDDRVIGPKGS